MISRKTFLLFCFFILYYCSFAWGTYYYIDPAGNDGTGDGSAGNPWYSLSYTCSQVATSGDVIHINAGTYTDTGYCLLAVGVDIEGAGRGSVIINSSAGHPTYGSYISAVSVSETIGNHNIHDFTIDGGDTANLWGIRTRHRHNVTIYNMGIQNFARTGVRVEGYPDTQSNFEPPYYATGVSIHDNIFTNTSYGVMEPDLHYGALEIESLEGATIYNNTMNEDEAGRGVGIKHANYGWFKGVDIYNNTISTYFADANAFVVEVYNFCDDSRIRDNTFNGPFSLNGGLHTKIAGSDWNLQIYDNTFNLSAWTEETFVEASHYWLDFYQNYIVGNDTYIRGVGIWTTNYLTADSVDHVRIRNNIIYNTAETSIYIANNAKAYDDIQIYNNIIDTVNAVVWGGFGISVIGNSTVTNMVIKNNVVLNAENRWLYLQVGVSGAVCSNNYHYGNGDSDNYWSIGPGNVISNNTHGDPEINRSGDRPDPYYSPFSQSANIVDSGTDVGLPFFGIAPDVGAYEYGSEPLPPPAAPSKLRLE